MVLEGVEGCAVAGAAQAPLAAWKGVCQPLGAVLGLADLAWTCIRRSGFAFRSDRSMTSDACAAWATSEQLL